MDTADANGVSSLLEKAITIVIVEDHPLMRKGIRDMIELEADMRIVGEAESAGEAIRLIAEKKPSIAIVDITLKGEANGIDLIRSIASREIPTKTIVLSMHDETFFAERAIRAGARGYLVKSEAPQTLIQAIREVYTGGMYVSAGVSGTIIRKFIEEPPAVPHIPIEDLSDRELEILRLIGEGYRSRDIAKKLNLSVNTVETHRKNIRAKLGCADSSELTRHAIAWLHSRKT